jgi:hypothetical protein
LDKRNLWMDWVRAAGKLGFRKANPGAIFDVVDLVGVTAETLGSFGNLGVLGEVEGVGYFAGLGVEAGVMGVSVSVIPG